jgi:hypothetical protein
MLFWLTLGAAALLLLGVSAAPWILSMAGVHEGWWRIILLFANDTTLRRTAVASAIGLMVTAFVFFRPSSLSRRASSKQLKLPPPANMAGA